MAEKKRKYILFNKDDGRDGPKPCAFFASAAGCRNGDKCSFQHLAANAYVHPGGQAAPVAAPAAAPAPVPMNVPASAQAPRTRTSKDEVTTSAKKVRTEKPTVPFTPMAMDMTPMPSKAQPMDPPTKTKRSSTKKAAPAPAPAVQQQQQQQSNSDSGSDDDMDDSQFLFSAVNEALKGGLQPSPAAALKTSNHAQQQQQQQAAATSSVDWFSASLTSSSFEQPSALAQAQQQDGFHMGTTSSASAPGSSGKKAQKERTPRAATETSSNNNNNSSSNMFLQGNDVLQRLASSGTSHATFGPLVGRTATPTQDSKNSATASRKNKPLQTQLESVPAPAPSSSSGSFLFAGLPISAVQPSSSSAAPAPAPTVQQNTRKPTNSAAAQASAPATAPVIGNNIPAVLQAMIMKTRAHPRYASEYAFNADSTWVQAKPYGDWCKDPKFPRIIGIDCEMCETADPVSGGKDGNALIRLSVVNGDDAKNNFETVLDTLVNPLLPITDCKTAVHGIQESQLTSVQFTLRHAQAAMLSMCSDNTIIVGHSLHGDLKSLKFIQPNALFIDTSYLYDLENEAGKCPSLRDVAHFASNVALARDRTHDSVQDAKLALHGMYRVAALMQAAGGGGVSRTAVSMSGDPNIVISRADKNSGLTHPANQCLLVHRIPNNYSQEDISKMFTSLTHIAPMVVPPVTGSNGKEGDVGSAADGNVSGKTVVVFSSEAHCNLAFDTLTGPNRPDKSNRAQKRVYLKNGGHICVRKY